MAASATAKHIHQIMQQTRGYGPEGGSSAVDAVRIDGLPNDDDGSDLADALTIAEAALGDTHYNDSTLPLRQITVRKTAKTKAVAIGRYARSRGTTPIASANALTSRRTGSHTVTWWRDWSEVDAQGRPNGDITFYPHTDTEASSEPSQLRPRPWRWRHGVLVLSMPTVLSTVASALYTSYYGKINSNMTAQWLNTGLWPAKSLMFMGVNTVPIPQADGTVKYQQAYQVVYNPYLWKQMTTPVFNTTTEAWETTLEDAAEAVVFPTFTVHS